MALNKRKAYIFGAISIIVLLLSLSLVVIRNNDLSNTNDKLKVKVTDSNGAESNLQVSANDQNGDTVQYQDNQSQSKLYGVNELVVDANLNLSPEDYALMQANGIKNIKLDPNSQYKAQYLDGVITARNQVEFDKYRYHELGHHIYMTKMSADDKGLFDGSGYASKQAIGRPGYTQLDIISEDFAFYFDMAMQGRINEIPEKYRTVVSRYAQ